MAKERSPAYSWYPKDALSSSRMALMSAAEEGIYRRLLDRQWLDGSIPGSIEELAILARVPRREMRAAWPAVSACFSPTGGGRLANERLEAERQKQRARAEVNRVAGAAGGRAKWGSDRDEANRDKRSQRLSEARARGEHGAEEWAEMVTAFAGICPRCGESGGEIVKDHVIPIYQGGDDAITNLQPLCRSCNSQKGPERTDYRQRLQELTGTATLAKWFRPASVSPDEMPSERLANACLSSASSSTSAQVEEEEATPPLVRERGKPPPVPEPGDEVMLHFRAGEELRGEKSFDLRRRKVDEWAEAFPGIDIMATARSSRQWLRDNPAKRKTARGMTKFLHSRLEWLANNGNGGRGVAPTPDRPQRRFTPAQAGLTEEHLATYRARGGSGE